MRGLGTIFRQRKSRFLWMQYFVDGLRIRESTKREKLKEAQDVLKNKLLEIQQQTASDGAPATIAELYAGILADYEMNGRKSIDHVRGAWKNHLKTCFAIIAPLKLTSSQIVE